jgi:pyruvate/2-oxoglutarate dehydrogenase complex dihydrolipoamide acyltransferase (E2) component
MIEILAPKENVDDTMLISHNYFNSGDKVKADDEVMDLETSKTVFSIQANHEGYIEYLVEAGETVAVGQVIIRIHAEMFVPATTDKRPNGAGDASSYIDTENKVVSAKAKEYIEKNGIDITGIQKSYITLNDVIEFCKVAPEVATKTQPGFKVSALDANIETEKKTVSLAKQTEIQALSYVQSSGLVSTIFVTVEAEGLPKSENLLFKSSGTFLPLISHEVAQLLPKFRLLNGYFESNNIYLYNEYNLGIALDIDDGLKVFSVKNADQMSLQQTEMKIGEGIYAYFRKSLTPDMIKGSTFTITDLSSFGVDRFVPLVNYKQSAILGIGSVDKKIDRFTLSLSFDHRVTEGKLASQFLGELAKRIQLHSKKNS